MALNDGQVEKSSYHGRCQFEALKCLIVTLESRSFVAVVVSLSGPISRDTAILSLRYPISRDTFSARLALPQNGAIPPP